MYTFSDADFSQGLIGGLNPACAARLVADLRYWDAVTRPESVVPFEQVERDVFSSEADLAGCFLELRGQWRHLLSCALFRALSRGGSFRGKLFRFYDGAFGFRDSVEQLEEFGFEVIDDLLALRQLSCRQVEVGCPPRVYQVLRGANGSCVLVEALL